jgi:adenosylcobinamide-GDP ribazoletransferase
VQAAVPGVAAARAGGFGALVAGSARPLVAAGLTGLVLAAGAGLAWTAAANPLGWLLAQIIALAVGAALRWHLSRRLGGVTGDVFGALVEVTTAATLVGLALTVR